MAAANSLTCAASPFFLPCFSRARNLAQGFTLVKVRVAGGCLATALLAKPAEKTPQSGVFSAWMFGGAFAEQSFTGSA
jgi:hypothetical protein